MARTTKTTRTTKNAGAAKTPAPASKSSTPAAKGPTRADPAGARIVTPVTPATAKPASQPASADANSGTVATSSIAASSVPKVTDAPRAATAPGTQSSAGEPAAAAQKSGFIPLLLGGVVAGAIGFGVATWMQPEAPAANMNDDRLDALAAEVDALKATDAPPPDVSAIEAAQADLGGRIDTLEERIASLEARPIAAASDQPEQTIEAPVAEPVATASDVADLRSDLEGLETDVTTLRDDLTPRVGALENSMAEANTLAVSVEAQAKALAEESARNQVRLALQSGAPYADPLAVLGGEIPDALAANAETGVSAQAALIEAFPELSRSALRAARSSSPASGVGSLFQNAFNPRSLAPREGDDPDAVLSRAEAAVRAGELDAALTEVDKLPAEAQAVLNPWTTRARARAAAIAAADEYLQDG